VVVDVFLVRVLVLLFQRSSTRQLPELAVEMVLTVLLLFAVQEQVSVVLLIFTAVISAFKAIASLVSSLLNKLEIMETREAMETMVHLLLNLALMK
jgi:hypothetical protein